MATYKKRGYKEKAKKVEDVEQSFDHVEENSTTAEVFNTLDEGASKTEEWVAANQKYIFIGVGTIVILVLGWLGYQKYIQEPKEIEASNEMFVAQQYFKEAVEADAASKDSLYTLALNGAEGAGFLEIIEEYGGTKAGNLARYFAGFSYLNTNQYQKAIDYLDEFKAGDEILGPLATGGIGDAFSQLNQDEEALNYYQKAADMRENEFTTPRFLLKSALIALDLGKPEVAQKNLQKIKDKFPKSPEANQIEVHLGRAQAML
ncbi:tetratricopeptide repeat protein [Aquimarina sp. ERC-38]|uniref:tetratricopeptide repeat protein n=1 Tax=Aquimarina sp. ERC-38 TaxID=2949996 RepID=UPI002246C91A|nr:tetratricopeptide repeat protein [Aquimarina sp. ERC-38]UZO79943.1 tetratricopeptide repeat protein [Aquimarina sp. ERC-38]